MPAHIRTVVVTTFQRPWQNNKRSSSQPTDIGHASAHPEANFKVQHHNRNDKARIHQPPAALHFTAPPRSSGLHSAKTFGYGACSDCVTPFDIQAWAASGGQGQGGQQGQPLFTASPTGGLRSSLRNSPERHRASLDRVPEDGMMDFSQSDEEVPRYLGGASLSDDSSEMDRELEEELEEHGLYRGSYRRLVLLYGTVPLTFAIAFPVLAALPYLLYPLQDTRRPPLYMPYFPSPIPEFLVSISLWSLFYVLQDPLYAFISYLISPLRSTSTLITTPASTLIQTIVSLLLRISSLNLLEIPRLSLLACPTTADPSFRRIWWVALGWAFAEAVVAIKQGYEAIGLYSDVLVSVTPHREDPETIGSINGGSSDVNHRKNETTPLEILRSTSTPSPRESHRDRSLSNSPNPPTDSENSGSSEQRRQTTVELFNQQVEDDVYGQAGELDEDGERQPLLMRKPGRERQREMEHALREQVDQDIDELIAMRAREELEEMYGLPVILIPVFLSCLHRINALFMSLGSLLLVSHAYMRSTLVVLPPVLHIGIPSFKEEIPRTNTPLFITLPIVAFIHFFHSILHTSLVLPRFGVPAVVYTGSLVSLMVFFAGLGVWNGLS